MLLHRAGAGGTVPTPTTLPARHLGAWGGVCIILRLRFLYWSRRRRDVRGVASNAVGEESLFNDGTSSEEGGRGGRTCKHHGVGQSQDRATWELGAGWMNVTGRRWIDGKEQDSCTLFLLMAGVRMDTLISSFRSHLTHLTHTRTFSLTLSASVSPPSLSLSLFPFSSSFPPSHDCRVVIGPSGEERGKRVLNSLIFVCFTHRALRDSPACFIPKINAMNL
ncbi:hypothetical protein LY76DRAFT_114783 [Colletotrichum caudatum]|nr:hypothetical protein LY76DRAFT_114783 [Colletotrichum caudatum]